MFKNLLIIVFVVLAGFGTLVRGQEVGESWIRITQLSFEQVDDDEYIIDVDLLLDGETLFPNVRYPFTTDYISTTPGDHVVSTAIEGTTLFDVPLSLEDGHRYIVIVHGDYAADTAEALVIDETDDTNALLVNLIEDSTALDASIDDETVLDDLGYREYAYIDGVVGDVSAKLMEDDEVLIEDDYILNPHTRIVAIVLGSLADGAFLVNALATDLTIAEFLDAATEDSPFSGMASVISSASLSETLDGEGQFTVFVPDDAAVDELPADTLTAVLNDSALLSDILSYHVVEGNYPPYELLNHEQLPTLLGTDIAFNFGQTDSGWWEINDTAPIYFDFRAANGIIYQIGGVLLPSED